MNDNLEKRRLARIPMRCVVVVREKLATWESETEDVGGRGCRIVLKRPVAPGALLRLRFETGGEPIEVVGQVAWVRRSPPLSAGIAFVSAPQTAAGASASWMDRLLVSHLRGAAARGLAAAPGSLGSLGSVTLRLGKPPERTFSVAELAVLELARSTGRLSTIACALDGPAALAALLEEGAVTIGPAAIAPGAERRSAPQAPAQRAAAAPASSAAVLVPPAPVAGSSEAVIEAAVAQYLRTG